MFKYSDLGIVKKAGLLVFLLMPSMLVQAQDAGAVVTNASGAAENTQIPDVAGMTVPGAQAAEAGETSASEDQPRGYQPRGDRQRKFSFPRWPESRTVHRERVPMAPPGPYMSSALTDYSFKGSSFDRNFDRYSSRRGFEMDSADMPIEQFSPDVPWPSHAESPDRWQPESGYRYVEPRVSSKPYQAKPYTSPSSYNSGYRRSPVMSWPDRGPARSRPVMNNPVH